jgi:hypothetical protein
MSMLAVLLTLESGEDNEEDTEKLELVEDAYLRLNAMLKGKQMAWNDFCVDLGVDGDDVMRAYFLDDEADMLTCLDLALAVEVEADESARARLLDNLRDVWSVVEGMVN